MATRIWEGGAPAVAQVVRLTPGGTIEADDRFQVTIGDRTLDIPAGGTTVADVCDAIVAAWSAAGPEFDEIAAADKFTCVELTAKTAGVPFEVSVSTTEADGSPADGQTFTASTITANQGPNCWDTASNWSGGAVPVTGDSVIIEDCADAILYGLDQSSVTLASLEIRRSFTGYLGLPRRNSNGYAEYRPHYLKIGATQCRIGDGQGDGPYRVKLDFGSVQTNCEVLHTRSARPDSALPIVLLKGTSASNVLRVIGADVGLAYYGEDSANFSGGVTIDGGNLLAGPNVTLDSVELVDGLLQTRSGVTTLNAYAGRLLIEGTAAVTNLTIYRARARYASTGTITNLKISGSGRLEIDRPCTITNAELHGSGWELADPAGLATFTSGIDLVRCAPQDGTLALPPHRTLTLSAI